MSSLDFFYRSQALIGTGSTAADMDIGFPQQRVLHRPQSALRITSLLAVTGCFINHRWLLPLQGTLPFTHCYIHHMVLPELDLLISQSCTHFETIYPLWGTLPIR